MGTQRDNISELDGCKEEKRYPSSSEEKIKAMQYETPTLLLVGPANSLILGAGVSGPIDRMPESDLRGCNWEESQGLDE